LAQVAVVAVVGASGSGKTTLLESLIPELRRRGRRVGAVKHTHHSFDFDPRGKDSSRLLAAGAQVVAFSSTAQLAVMRHLDEEVSLEEIIARYFGDLDLVLVEGYKELPLPKVEVVRGGRELQCSQEQLLAVVTDDRRDLRVPSFRPGDVAGLATFLETTVLGSTAS
jgi:molybdopterin-guanine dinucleotide biosynthesis protein MobB